GKPDGAISSTLAGCDVIRDRNPATGWQLPSLARPLYTPSIHPLHALWTPPARSVTFKIRWAPMWSRLWGPCGTWQNRYRNAPVEMVDTHLPESAAVSHRQALTPRLVSSLLAVIVGSLVLRIAAQTMGQMLQFYLAAIDRNYYHISFTTRGLVIASFFITELTGSPVLGALSDRFGRKSFIILGPLFGAIAVQISAMTIALWLLVVTRLLAGLSTASSIPPTLGYISEATSGRPNLRARVIGMFEITFVGGVAIGSVLSGYLWTFMNTPRDLGPLKLIAPAFSINGLVYLVSIAIF